MARSIQLKLSGRADMEERLGVNEGFHLMHDGSFEIPALPARQEDFEVDRRERNNQTNAKRETQQVLFC